MLWDIQEKEVSAILQFCRIDRINVRDSELDNILRRIKIQQYCQRISVN